MNQNTYGNSYHNQSTFSGQPSYSYKQQNLQISSSGQQNNKIPTSYQYQTSKQSNYVLPPKSKDAQFKDNKQRNKNMYSSSMAFLSSNQGLGKLSAFGRQVKQPVNQKEHLEGSKIQKINSQDKYKSLFENYSGTKDVKMASSAIFPTEQNQLDRFPSFNLGFNQPSQPSSKSYAQMPAPKANQTPKQKRQRELMEIKKQLDELNKKMIANTQKNKIDTADNNTQLQFKSTRPAVNTKPYNYQPISTTGTTNTYKSFEHKHTDSKPSSVNTGISSDYHYTQPKKYQPLKINSNSQQSFETKPYSSTYSPNYNTYSTSSTTKGNNSYEKQLNNNGTKTYQFEKKIQQPTYKNTSYEPIPTYKYTEKYTYQNTTNNSTTNTGYSNNYLPKTDKYTPSYSQSIKSPQYNYSNSLSYQNQNKSAANVYKGYNNPSSTSNSSTSSTSSTSSNSNSYNSPYSAQYTAEGAHTYNNYKLPNQTNAVLQGGFKKKKGPVAEIIQSKNQIDMKQPKKPDTSTMTHQEVPYRAIRRIETTDYDDPNVPIIQPKKFKITDFIVGKKMGKGQFGQVLFVRHKETGWICGLKVMNKKDIKDQDYVGQIARQLSIQFYLAHRNIAQLFGYFQDQKNFYLLIQFCKNGQLLQRLKQQRRMSQRDVSLIIRQVCEGVDYIHRQLIIHRDIKPQNMMFNLGVVKIVDFGWAVYRGFGMRKTASGSPLYYPPQIVKGQSYDDKIDIWCIGMMAYQCIIGKVPFKVYTELDLGRIVTDQITFPSWVDVSDQAKDFILKTLKKNGDERLQIKQMLRHPFITKHQQNQLSASILQQFKKVLS